MDRIARVTSYNNSALLSGYGNVVSEDAAVSTALASPTTGVVDIQISGAAAGTYSLIDSTGDGEITMGNGVATQTINIRPSLDFDAVGGAVATGSSIIASFDRLGVQFTLSGQRAAQGIDPATDGYRDGDLNGTEMIVEAGTGGTFQVGPDDGAVHRLELNINDLSASGARLNLGTASISTMASAQGVISSIDLAIENVTRSRGDLGAMQNRLSFGIRATGVMLESDQSTEGSIRDADIAEEVSAFSRAQILTQSGIALFAQANIAAASALSLL